MSTRPRRTSMTSKNTPRISKVSIQNVRVDPVKVTAIANLSMRPEAPAKTLQYAEQSQAVPRPSSCKHRIGPSSGRMLDMKSLKESKETTSWLASSGANLRSPTSSYRKRRMSSSTATMPSWLQHAQNTGVFSPTLKAAAFGGQQTLNNDSDSDGSPKRLGRTKGSASRLRIEEKMPLAVTRPDLRPTSVLNEGMTWLATPQPTEKVMQADIRGLQPPNYVGRIPSILKKDGAVLLCASKSSGKKDSDVAARQRLSASAQENVRSIFDVLEYSEQTGHALSSGQKKETDYAYLVFHSPARETGSVQNRPGIVINHPHLVTVQYKSPPSFTSLKEVAQTKPAAAGGEWGRISADRRVAFSSSTETRKDNSTSSPGSQISEKAYPVIGTSTSLFSTVTPSQTTVLKPSEKSRYRDIPKSSSYVIITSSPSLPLLNKSTEQKDLTVSKKQGERWLKDDTFFEAWSPVIRTYSPGSQNLDKRYPSAVNSLEWPTSQESQSPFSHTSIKLLDRPEFLMARAEQQEKHPSVVTNPRWFITEQGKGPPPLPLLDPRKPTKLSLMRDQQNSIDNISDVQCSSNMETGRICLTPSAASYDVSDRYTGVMTTPSWSRISQPQSTPALVTSIEQKILEAKKEPKLAPLPDSQISKEMYCNHGAIPPRSLIGQEKSPPSLISINPTEKTSSVAIRMPQRVDSKKRPVESSLTTETVESTPRISRGVSQKKLCSSALVSPQHVIDFLATISCPQTSQKLSDPSLSLDHTLNNRSGHQLERTPQFEVPNVDSMSPFGSPSLCENVEVESPQLNPSARHVRKDRLSTTKGHTMLSNDAQIPELRSDLERRNLHLEHTPDYSTVRKWSPSLSTWPSLSLKGPDESAYSQGSVKSYLGAKFETSRKKIEFCDEASEEYGGFLHPFEANRAIAQSIPDFLILEELSSRSPARPSPPKKIQDQSRQGSFTLTDISMFDISTSYKDDKQKDSLMQRRQPCNLVNSNSIPEKRKHVGLVSKVGGLGEHEQRAPQLARTNLAGSRMLHTVEPKTSVIQRIEAPRAPELRTATKGESEEIKEVQLRTPRKEKGEHKIYKPSGAPLVLDVPHDDDTPSSAPRPGGIDGTCSTTKKKSLVKVHPRRTESQDGMPEAGFFSKANKKWIQNKSTSESAPPHEKQMHSGAAASFSVPYSNLHDIDGKPSGRWDHDEKNRFMTFEEDSSPPVLKQPDRHKSISPTSSRELEELLGTLSPDFSPSARFTYGKLYGTSSNKRPTPFKQAELARLSPDYSESKIVQVTRRPTRQKGMRRITPENRSCSPTNVSKEGLQNDRKGKASLIQVRAPNSQREFRRTSTSLGSRRAGTERLSPEQIQLEYSQSGFDRIRPLKTRSESMQSPTAQTKLYARSEGSIKSRADHLKAEESRLGQLVASGSQTKLSSLSTGFSKSELRRKSKDDRRKHDETSPINKNHSLPNSLPQSP